jgi:hypothetical protein
VEKATAADIVALLNDSQEWAELIHTELRGV